MKHLHERTRIFLKMVLDDSTIDSEKGNLLRYFIYAALSPNRRKITHPFLSFVIVFKCDSVQVCFKSQFHNSITNLHCGRLHVLYLCSASLLCSNFEPYFAL